MMYNGAYAFVRPELTLPTTFGELTTKIREAPLTVQDYMLQEAAARDVVKQKPWLKDAFRFGTLDPTLTNEEFDGTYDRFMSEMGNDAVPVPNKYNTTTQNFEGPAFRGDPRVSGYEVRGANEPFVNKERGLSTKVITYGIGALLLAAGAAVGPVVKDMFKKGGSGVAGLGDVMGQEKVIEVALYQHLADRMAPGTLTGYGWSTDSFGGVTENGCANIGVHVETDRAPTDHETAIYLKFIGHSVDGKKTSWTDQHGRETWTTYGGGTGQHDSIWVDEILEVRDREYALKFMKEKKMNEENCYKPA